jgi:hypothetical protein
MVRLSEWQGRWLLPWKRLVRSLRDFKPDRIQWYGEVSGHTQCAYMGNGYPGSDSRAVGFTQLKSVPNNEYRRHSFVTDRNLYSPDVATRVHPMGAW